MSGSRMEKEVIRCQIKVNTKDIQTAIDLVLSMMLDNAMQSSLLEEGKV